MGFGKPRVTFSKCTITSTCKRELWMSSLPTHLPILFWLENHTSEAKFLFPRWCFPAGLPGTLRPPTGHSRALQHRAVPPAHAARTRCPAPGSSARLLLAASPRCLTHPGHKLFIRATEHQHKPHSFNKTSHASASKCRDDSGRGDTGRTARVECTRDSSSSSSRHQPGSGGRWSRWNRELCFA